MNFGDMLEAVEAAIGPDEPAFIHGDTVIQWGEAARRSNNLARALIARGPTPGDKLAIYLRNGPDYLIAMAAAFKARLVPVNVNYRYGSGELTYLLDNADATAVVYGAEFRDRVDAIRDRLPGVRHWIGVGEADASDPVEALYDEGDGTPLRLARSPDDLHFIYTGGTTGMPKGVMWPHRDLWTVMVAGLAAQGAAVPDSAAALGAMIAAGARGPRLLPAPPLMHGTGMISALNALLWGGTVVTLTGATFDAGETLRAIERHRPTVLVIVGDSFARPLLDALDAAPGAHDLTSVTSILSSGRHVERREQARVAAAHAGRGAERCAVVVGGAGAGRVGDDGRCRGDHGTLHARPALPRPRGGRQLGGAGIGRRRDAGARAA